MLMDVIVELATPVANIWSEFLRLLPVVVYPPAIVAAYGAPPEIKSKFNDSVT
jgi:hypothetical protein